MFNSINPNRSVLSVMHLRSATILICFFSFCGSFAQNDCTNPLTAFQQYGVWGYKNKATGAVVVTPQYDFADYLFADGVTKVTKWKLAGLINCYGTEVISCKYDDIVWNTESHSYISSEGYVKVKMYKKYGLLTKTGKEITTCKYEDIGAFSDSIALVKILGKSGCINILGKEIIPCSYSEILRDKTYTDLLLVSKDSKYGVFNKYGKEIVPCKYNKITIGKNGVQVKLDEKLGLFDAKGTLIIPCEFDAINEFYDSLSLVKKDEKFGFYNKNGILVIPCEYDEILWNEKKHNYFPGGKVTVKKDGKYGIIDKKGNALVNCKYDWEFHLPVFSEYGEVIKDGMKGIISRTGKEILPCKYEEIIWDYDPEKNSNIPADISGKKLFTVMSEGKWGVVDGNNKVVIPVKYEEFDCFVNGLAAASLNGKWGYINMHDSIAVPFIYDYCQSFDNKLAIAGYYEFDKTSNTVINKLGLINLKGKDVLPFEYSVTWLKAENVYVFSTTEGKVGIADSNGKVFIEPEYQITPSWDSWRPDGLIKAYDKISKKYGFYSDKGKIIIPFKYTDAGNFSEGMVVVREGFKWGYVNEKGKEIIPYIYDEAYAFSEGLALVRLNAVYGYVNAKGDEIIKPQYVAAGSFCDGFAKVQEEESTYGLIDKTGKVIIPATQENILFNSTINSHFTEGLALVQKNSLFGYYDKQGVQVISCKYSWADFFSYNRALVKDTAGKYRFIDKAGRFAFAGKYAKANSFNKGYAIVKVESSYQMIDTLGSVKKTFSYDEIKSFYDGPAAVRLGKLWGFIDEKGDEIIVPKYEKAASFRNGEAQVEVDGEIYRINVNDEIVGQGMK